MMEPSAGSIQLHPMRPAHLDRICQIERACFSNPWPRESFLSDLGTPQARCTVALMKEMVVGYAIGWFVLDELHVLNLAVGPRHRRRGIGRDLLSDLLAAAQSRGCRHASLELRSSNHHARRLYEKYGFRPVAIRRRYYRYPTEDAFVMLLDLESMVPLRSPGSEVADGVVSEG
jgi:ribosomal-protein-alanine N-acetyltransferase